MGEGASPGEGLPEGLGFLGGGGEATRLILGRDWSDHPLGPPGGWPATLRTALGLVLNSPESMILCWGRERLSFFFNEAYIPLLGPRLPRAMGAPLAEVWADGWEQARPIVEDAFAGRAERFTDLPWRLDTDRGAAETWWSFSYSRVLDEGGAVVGLFILTSETTARVLADRDLARAQGELMALNATLERRVEERTAQRDRMWAASPDLMIVVSADGVCRRANPAWAAVLGYRPEEVEGMDALDLVHPDDLAATRDALARAVAGTLPPFENRFRHRDGGHRWIQWSAAPGPGEVFAIGRDVTAAREGEALLRQTEEALRQSQKMEAVGQLTGGLAHDFNNLLAGISGSLELMQARIRQGRLAEVERYMAAAQGAARRAASLTHRLLAFSRRQPLDPRPTDVGRLALGMQELIQRTVGPDVAVEVTGEPGLWTALVDPPQLENALLNLCINARDAMPDGGRITVAGANRRVDAAAAAEDEVPEGEYLSLRVTDTGTGMPPEVLARVFEPFFTTKPIGQGTGLGLSMIYGFAKQSGGEVRVRSEPGRGTEVRLLLPRHRGEAEEDAAARPGAPPARSGGGGTVLVVDDEPTVRMLLVDILADLGLVALEAGDGEAGLRILRSDARIDLLVTDVGLPGGMNGRQMAEAAREHRPGLRVLFVTGYAEEAILGPAGTGPGAAVVTKPFAVAAMADRIRAMIEAG